MFYYVFSLLYAALTILWLFTDTPKEMALVLIGYAFVSVAFCIIATIKYYEQKRRARMYGGKAIDKERHL